MSLSKDFGAINSDFEKFWKFIDIKKQKYFELIELKKYVEVLNLECPESVKIFGELGSGLFSEGMIKNPYMINIHLGLKIFLTCDRTEALITVERLLKSHVRIIINLEERLKHICVSSEKMST